MADNVPEEHVRMGVARARQVGGRRSTESGVAGVNWSGAPLSSMGSIEGVRH